MKHLAINILRNAWLPIPPSSRVDKGMHIYIEIYIYFKKDFFWGTKRFRRARFPRYISFHVLHLCSVSNQVVSECYCIFLKLQVDIKLQYSQQHYGSTHGSSSKGCWMQKASLNLIRVFKPNAMHHWLRRKAIFCCKSSQLMNILVRSSVHSLSQCPLFLLRGSDGHRRAWPPVYISLCRLHSEE